ncbi:adhesion G protein-coupled receptor B2 [Trichonephila clavipes]|nr:adhesion G protein-coupled receptor B2 [Trichonephila clavipes]
MAASERFLGPLLVHLMMQESKLSSWGLGLTYITTDMARTLLIDWWNNLTKKANFTPDAAVLFVDVAIQPEVRFIAKQNSLMKIGNNDNLVLGPFDESTPCLMIVFDELPNQTENKSFDSC